MSRRRVWNHGHPLLLLAGLVLILFGLAVLIGLGVMLYDRSLSAQLLRLGIPGALLVELAALASAFGGGAIFAAAWVTRRRRSV